MAVIENLPNSINYPTIYLKSLFSYLEINESILVMFPLKIREL